MRFLFFTGLLIIGTILAMERQGVFGLPTLEEIITWALISVVLFFTLSFRWWTVKCSANKRMKMMFRKNK